MKPQDRAYCGRFAPSPTGPLHFGSLLAATASYLDAKLHQGCWIVRMEDVDRDREQPGAADRILRDLEAFGFEWDGPVVRQSERTEAYQESLQQLQAAGLLYPCGCSRKEIADSAIGGGAPGGQFYPGTCKDGLPAGKPARSWRVRTGPEPVCFDDRLQGRRCQNLAGAVGDFVLRRADNQFAYQLAVVVDDAAQGVTDVVRGADLLDSTPRQIHLQRLLGLPNPRYLHIPVAVDGEGNKLSKQTRALPIDPQDAPRLLCRALRFLGQAPPAELDGAAVADVWVWATSAWSPRRLPAATVLVACPQ